MKIKFLGQLMRDQNFAEYWQYWEEKGRNEIKADVFLIFCGNSPINLILTEGISAANLVGIMVLFVFSASCHYHTGWYIQSCSNKRSGLTWIFQGCMWKGSHMSGKASNFALLRTVKFDWIVYFLNNRFEWPRTSGRMRRLTWSTQESVLVNVFVQFRDIREDRVSPWLSHFQVSHCD